MEWKPVPGLAYYESLTFGAFDLEIATGIHVDQYWFTIWCVDLSHEDYPRTVVFTSGTYDTRDEAREAALAKMRQLLDEATEAIKNIENA